MELIKLKTSTINGYGDWINLANYTAFITWDITLKLFYTCDLPFAFRQIRPLINRCKRKEFAKLRRKFVLFRVDPI